MLKIKIINLLNTLYFIEKTIVLVTQKRIFKIKQRKIELNKLYHRINDSKSNANKYLKLKRIFELRRLNFSKQLKLN